MCRPRKYPYWMRDKVCWIRKRHFRSVNEIAETMEMPPSTVSAILREAGLGGPVSELRKARIQQYKVDGLSVKEIAIRVGTTATTVRYALSGKRNSGPVRSHSRTRQLDRFRVALQPSRKREQPRNGPFRPFLD